MHCRVMCVNEPNHYCTSRADLETELSFLREVLVRSNDAKELRVTFPVRFTPLVSKVASAMLIFRYSPEGRRIPLLTPPGLEPVTSSLCMYS